MYKKASLVHSEFLEAGYQSPLNPKRLHLLGPQTPESLSRGLGFRVQHLKSEHSLVGHLVKR